jgi:hypothetical protein
MRELLRLTGTATKSAAVETAIAEYVRRRRIESSMAIAGKLDFGLDWRRLEAEEVREPARPCAPRARRRRRGPSAPPPWLSLEPGRE